MWRNPEHIDWDATNTSHIEAADLSREEVESVLDDPDSEAIPGRRARDGTPRWKVFGTTHTGKRIIVIFDTMSDDPFYVRPVTAYEVPRHGDAD
jgi:uncharacterized DUF497 family protein